MEKFSFIFTICFVLLGPLKIIPAYARLTSSNEPRDRRKLAILATLVAGALCLFVAVAGRALVSRYELSLPALQLGGGLVLLLSALGAMFPRSESPADTNGRRTTLQVAFSPLATPIIVTPAGVAAIFIFAANAQRYPGIYQALGLALAAILVLDFLVMFFHSSILRVPGLVPTLQVLGAVLVFIQVALAIETMLRAAKALGVIAA